MFDNNDLTYKKANEKSILHYYPHYFQILRMLRCKHKGKKSFKSKVRCSSKPLVDMFVLTFGGRSIYEIFLFTLWPFTKLPNWCCVGFKLVSDSYKNTHYRYTVDYKTPTLATEIYVIGGK